MEGSLPRPARSRPLEQPTAPPARRRDDAKRLPLVLSLLAVLAITFVLTENRRIERRSHFEEKTRRGGDDLHAWLLLEHGWIEAAALIGLPLGAGRLGFQPLI